MRGILGLHECALMRISHIQAGANVGFGLGNVMAVDGLAVWVFMGFGSRLAAPAEQVRVRPLHK